jgi:hypothetical protein
MAMTTQERGSCSTTGSFIPWTGFGPSAMRGVSTHASAFAEEQDMLTALRYLETRFQTRATSRPNWQDADTPVQIRAVIGG